MNEKSKYYYEKGYKFTFNSSDYKIAVVNSIFGKLIISINGDVVFKGRILNTRSSHKIAYDNKTN